MADFISPAEFAKATGTHPQLVRRWCRQGDIPSIKVGRKLLIPKSFLEPKGNR